MQLLWPLILNWGLAIFGMVVLAYVIRRLLKHWRRRSAQRQLIERCPCGYPLQGLALARCPECGRVIGFDATAEELGLSDEELKRAIEVRNRRAAEKREGA
jgi:hypothetical protein